MPEQVFIMKQILYVVLFGILMGNAQAQTLPPGISGDTLHAPFYHGVASGDPLSDAVIIWTRISPLGPDDSLMVYWEMATDSVFTVIIAADSTLTDSTSDWTVKLDVTGLNANTTYYYRFHDAIGNTSMTGRTRTAPVGQVNELKFAVASCSSVFSGYFNAYRRIGERDDLNLVIHVGDYIYDFVDEDEEVRIPDPYPVNPSNRQEWRKRHAYYLLDEDLRYARSRHPFTVLWDNHDIDKNSAQEAGSIQAFQEWVPVREVDSLSNRIIYKTLHYGDLVDVIMWDIWLFRNDDNISPGNPSILGDVQYQWMENEVLNSTAKWRIYGSQNMMGRWIGPPLLGGGILDDTSWDGFVEARDRIFNLWRSNAIDNNIVVSGDAHISMAIDLTDDPDGLAVYDSVTGNGAVGVEFLPSSITRGNLDEAGLGNFVDAALAGSYLNNPNHVYSEFIQHGYGLLTVNEDSTIAEFLYSPILAPSDSDRLGAGLVVFDGDDHWSRDIIFPPDTTTSVFNPTPGIDPDLGYDISPVIPNPVAGAYSVYILLNEGQAVEIELYEVGSGKKVTTLHSGWLRGGTTQTMQFNGATLAKGSYLLQINGNGFSTTRTLVKQ